MCVPLMLSVSLGRGSGLTPVVNPHTENINIGSGSILRAWRPSQMINTRSHRGDSNKIIFQLRKSLLKDRPENSAVVGPTVNQG